MTDRTYPRPAVELDALLDAIIEAGADTGTAGIGNPDIIVISLEGANAEEIDAIWEKAMRGLALKDLAQLDQEEIDDIETLRAKLDAGPNSDLTDPITSETFEDLRRRARGASDHDDGLL
ncbi:hypothetical protein K3758_08180 [Sulfitobacter sp. W002]|uniref:hypothetical protein n=1 Tax=Sulfitobacter sp. W002 TaxID=2867024 RepID=UPI0021A8561C|nr:hypothetical protein [Sulfitobacter sp. W002]UWR31465.1 hypothetical protein K3758_08180 [Sulfitobacter sp. W002]